MRRIHVFVTLIWGAALAASLAVGSAQAAVQAFHFSYSTISGGPLTSSGAGTLVATPEGGGSYLVTGATGTIDGYPLALIAPGGFALNDNLLFPTSGCASGVPVADLDSCGLSFVVNSADYNLYYDPGPAYGGVLPAPSYAVCIGTPCLSGPPNSTAVNFSLSAVPEPYAWTLLAVGFAALGLGRRRVRSKRFEVAD